MLLPDGRLVVVIDADKALRLVETETGRTVARLESPDSCNATYATFSPDGSRLVVVTNDGPAVHVWDLRAIRRHLASMNLDWDAPAYSNLEPGESWARLTSKPSGRLRRACRPHQVRYLDTGITHPAAHGPTRECPQRRRGLPSPRPRVQ